MAITELTIVGMENEACLRTLMNALQDLPCLGQVDVALSTGQALIEHSSMLSAADIQQAIIDAGFAVR